MENPNETPSEKTTVEVLDDVILVDEPVKKKRDSKNAFWPFLLILAGIVLLIQNLGIVPVHFNWWALFIFIPVLGSLTTAWSAWQKSGKFNTTVRSSLGSALVIGTAATILLLGLSWARLWPLMVISAGISAAIGGAGQVDPQKHKNLAAWAGFNLWVGLAVALLGVGFLISFLVCLRNEYKMNWTVWAFVGIGVAVSATGLFAFFNLQWGLLAPIILITAGLVVMSGILIKK
jgi:hypothetical protein